MKRRIFYVGYELIDGQAPHQGMAALWLALNGHHVTFFAMSNEPRPRWVEEIPTLDFRTFTGKRRVAGLKLMRSLHAMLRKERPDYCYVQGAQLAALTAWIPFRFPKQKIIYHSQDFRPFITRLYSTAERVLARRSDMVICNEINRAKLLELVHGLPQTPEVIRTSLPAPWYVPDGRVMRERVLQRVPEDRRSGAVLIAVGGGFASRRKSKELVESLAHLDANHFLVFTGMDERGDAMSACLATAEAAGVKDRLIFLESLEYFELLSFYSACNLGVLLYCDSDLENFYQGPGRVTEYTRAGIPFVTSQWPGLELLTLKYGVGEAADPDNPQDIARAIRLLSQVGEEEEATRSARLKETARTDLAYEHDAKHVLGGRFPPDPDYAEHRFWDYTRDYCRSRLQE